MTTSSKFRIGHVQAVVDEILRYRAHGNLVLESQARRTYEEILANGVEYSRSTSIREQLAELARLVAQPTPEVQS